MRKPGLFILMLTISLTGSAATCDYTIEKVDYKNLVAKVYLPKREQSVPAVIAFGGSEGGMSTGESSGELLAPNCIAVRAKR